MSLKQQLQKGNAGLTSVSRQRLFVLERTRHLGDDADTEAEYFAVFCGKNARPYMIAYFANRTRRHLSPVFLFLITALLLNTSAVSPAFSQTAQTQGGTRKAKSSPPPEYPELARKMKIEGVARVLLTVNSEGSVVKVKELGGNPVLVDALAQAAYKWKYEPAERGTEIEVRYEFVLNP